MVRVMEQEIIKTIEADLREVVEAEVFKFRDRYSECKKVDSIYFNEDVSIGVYDVPLHGLICNHYLNIFVTSEALYEFPEFSCYVVFEDKERDFIRRLAHLMLIYTPVENRCYIKTEIHDYEIREVVEHIVRIAAAEEAEA
jgi:hypothetical protein